MSNFTRKFERRRRAAGAPACPRCKTAMKWRGRPAGDVVAAFLYGSHRWQCPRCTWEIRPTDK